MKKLPVLLLLVFVFSNHAFALPSALPEVKTYDQLVHAIRGVRTARQQAVDRERVREAWETGKLINDHILFNKKRANYGWQVLRRLAADLGVSHTELKYRLQFARAYPIGQPADLLTWSHYIELLSLKDAKERDAVAKEAVRRGWTRDQVREEVRKRKNKGSSPLKPKVLEARPGKPGTYRIVKATAGEHKGELEIGRAHV